MRVLVTGSEGYIGTLLVPMLETAGHRVSRLDTLLFSQCAYQDIPDLAGVCTTDVRDVDIEMLSGHDAVIHLAGLSNDPLSDLAPQLTDQINNTATVRLARLAKEAGVRRFVFSSSCSVYGFQGDEMVDESAPLNPLTPYAVSKAKAEKEILSFNDNDFTVVSLRHGTAYGASPMIRFDLVVNNLVAWAHTTGRVRLKSDGSAWRPLVHVDDICSAFQAALEADRASVSGEVFNIGRTADNVRIRDLAEMIVNRMPGCEIEFAPGASPDTRSYRVDCTRAEKRLPGFTPRIHLGDGIQQVIDSLKTSRVSGQQFETERYARIAHLKHRLASGTLDKDLRVNG